MIRPAPGIPVYLYTKQVDMRKSINGLSLLVEQEMALSPFDPALFVFCNRQRDKIKILCWERNGFILWYKRLEKHRFKWPQGYNSITIDSAVLNRLLDGYDIQPPQAHPALNYRSLF